MKKRFIENIWLRVIAVVMGLLLWFHVATEKIYTYQLTLPVSQVLLSDQLAISGETPDSLAVMVLASGKQLLRKKWRREGIRINATHLSAGRHSLTLTTQNSSLVGSGSPVTLDEIIFPATIAMNIDYRLEKSIPVEVNLTVEPDEGFAVSNISESSPSTVTISGPRSVIQRISSIATVPRSVNGLRNDISLTLPLQPTKSLAEYDFQPDSVSVEIEIRPVKTNRFESLPVVIYNVPTGIDAEPNPAQVAVELVGSPDEIDQLDPNSIIASVDYRNLRPGTKQVVKISHPPKFRLKLTEPDSISIRIQ